MQHVQISNGVGYFTLSGGSPGTVTLNPANLQSGTSSENNTIYNPLSLTVNQAQEPQTPEPKVAVILLMGLSSQLNSNTYNPSTNIGQTANWSNLNKYFDKYNLGQASNFMNSIASIPGAVILPFSYNGITLRSQNGVPNISIHGYTPADVGGLVLPDLTGNQVPQAPAVGTAAYQLNQEVQSIEQTWPQTKIIIIGHSEGGLVAERYFMDYYSSSTAPEVYKIFSLDSPINGVSGTFFPTLANIDPNFYLESNLLDYYHQLWSYFQTNGDNAVISKDEEDKNIYIPVGTPTDLLYDWASESKDVLLSQLLYDNKSDIYNFDMITPNAPQYPAFLIPPIPNFPAISESHHFVLSSPTVISTLTNTISSAENSN